MDSKKITAETAAYIATSAARGYMNAIEALSIVIAVGGNTTAAYLKIEAIEAASGLSFEAQSRLWESCAGYYDVA